MRIWGARTSVISMGSSNRVLNILSAAGANSKDCRMKWSVTSKPFLVSGIAERCPHENGGPGIPTLWHQFHQSVDHIPARIGKVAYGVCCNGDDAGNFDYVAGVEVADFSDLPREFARVRIPEQKYAVFTHAEHISTIRRTVHTIWNHWLPASGMKAADAPSFERYDENFDPATGDGGLEIWVPVRE